MLKLAALESTKNLDLEKKEGRIDDLLRVRRFYPILPIMQNKMDNVCLSNVGYKKGLNLY